MLRYGFLAIAFAPESSEAPGEKINCDFQTQVEQILLQKKHDDWLNKNCARFSEEINMDGADPRQPLAVKLPQTEGCTSFTSYQFTAAKLCMWLCKASGRSFCKGKGKKKRFV